MSEIVKTHIGSLKAIAFRGKRRETMQDINSCAVVAGKGLTAEERPASIRQVTLLDNQAWLAACRDLGVELSWLLRRANFLVVGIDLRDTVGSIITIGETRLMIRGQTNPCALMDYQHEGLKEALKPDWRGGVFGEVLDGATVSVGDDVTLYRSSN